MNATNNPYMLSPPPDKTLTQEGVAADAKAVGDRLATLPEMEHGCFVSPTTISENKIYQYIVNFSNSHSDVPKTVLLSYRTYSFFKGNIHIDTDKKNNGADKNGFVFVYIPTDFGNGGANLVADWLAIW